MPRAGRSTHEDRRLADDLRRRGWRAWLPRRRVDAVLQHARAIACLVRSQAEERQHAAPVLRAPRKVVQQRWFQAPRPDDMVHVGDTRVHEVHRPGPPRAEGAAGEALGLEPPAAGVVGHLLPTPTGDHILQAPRGVAFVPAVGGLRAQDLEHGLVEGPLVCLDGARPRRLLEEEVQEEAADSRVPHEHHTIVQRHRGAEVPGHHVANAEPRAPA
mmetsp:Transcript_112962/g.326343  ORF Transcript_112962/g.326343 Transcript_112962/m.326343 type:complete len:215 (-) Transcript_112962:999-1643(-)